MFFQFEHLTLETLQGDLLLNLSNNRNKNLYNLEEEFNCFVLLFFNYSSNKTFYKENIIIKVYINQVLNCLIK